MMQKQTRLVMAGSREAHGLISALLARNRRVIASLPEPERIFAALPVPTRIGGFATGMDLCRWLQNEQVGPVIDASHAFDGALCAMVQQACADLDLQYLRVLRPPWCRTARDKWLGVDRISQVMSALPERARVFTTTGWPTLGDYADFPGRKLYMRQTHAAASPAPFPFLEFIEGTPPFSQFQEQALFARLKITHLVCRNVGGAASMSKVLAARTMGIPVFMLARPPVPPEVNIVETVAEALAWEANA